MAHATTNFDAALAPFGEAVPVKTGFFARFLNALIESRMKQAEREIHRHEYLIGEINKLNDRSVATKRDELPF